MAFFSKQKDKHPEPDELKTKEEIAQAMFNLLTIPEEYVTVPHGPRIIHFMLTSALYSTSGIPDITNKRVWIQEYAASLNRKGLLSNENVQAFREYGYQYMHTGHKGFKPKSG